jgi:5-methylcytosine-specific restriction enzyme subunit McrC
MKFVARDCSPFEPQPSSKQGEWFRRLAETVRPSKFVLDLPHGCKDEDEAIVYCERDGRWWAGRYIGSLSFEGHQLVIHPRFGMSTMRHWLTQAGSLVVAQTPGQLKADTTFIAPLLALLWSTRLEQAARHGLPALRQQVSTRSSNIRGGLDVSASLPCFAARSGQVVSVHAERSMDHAASAAIVAAYEVLRRHLGSSEDKWIPSRAKELAMRLRAEIGSRPRIPTLEELHRVRYTPLTRGFESVARLSRQIAIRRGFESDADGSAEAHGVLLDVAELWELYVIEVLRRAVAPLTVIHGTRDMVARRKLLRSERDPRFELGTLIPDALVLDRERVVAVADAKYKRLHPTPSAPIGPQREDLYQMTAYLMRYGLAAGRKGMCEGLLLYPEDPRAPEAPAAEALGPWELEGGGRMRFVALPHQMQDAERRLRELAPAVFRLAAA